MVDFLSRLVHRTQGSEATIQPHIAPQFAPDPIIGQTSLVEASVEATPPATQAASAIAQPSTVQQPPQPNEQALQELSPPLDLASQLSRPGPASPELDANAEPVTTQRDIASLVDPVVLSQPSLAPDNEAHTIYPTEASSTINQPKNHLLNPPTAASHRQQAIPVPEFTEIAQTAQPPIEPEITQNNISIPSSIQSQSHTLVSPSVDLPPSTTSAAALNSQLSTVEPAIPAMYAANEAAFTVEESLSQSTPTPPSPLVGQIQNTQTAAVNAEINANFSLKMPGRRTLLSEQRQPPNSYAQSLFSAPVSQDLGDHISPLLAITQSVQSDRANQLPSSRDNHGSNRGNLDRAIDPKNPSPALAARSEIQQLTSEQKAILSSSSQILPNLAATKSLLAADSSAAISEQRTAASAPTIDITIGRIEIRAAAPAAPKAKPKARKQQPGLSLEQYLNQRNQG